MSGKEAADGPNPAALPAPASLADAEPAQVRHAPAAVPADSIADADAWSITPTTAAPDPARLRPPTSGDVAGGSG
ncbi:hypothetical protein ACFXG6_30650 [Streptomyces roseus]|uniref:hypothetical protein n=1 Tax=Streptomyces roseus TaxID=66430 RepID=UPI003673CA86